jgi:hypothetical protein
MNFDYEYDQHVAPGVKEIIDRLGGIRTRLSEVSAGVWALVVLELLHYLK